MFLKGKFRILLSVLAIAVLCTATVSASASRASRYIDWYSMDVLRAGSGKLGIEFSIEGTGKMTAIGAESIVVYRQSGSTWVYDGEYDRYDAGMTDSNTAKHGNTIYYQGVSGVKYKVTVTVFAENSTGSDSRTENFILTA